MLERVLNLLRPPKPPRQAVAAVPPVVNRQNPEGDRVKIDEILRNIQEGVIITNVDGQITFISRRALEILNTARSVVVNKNINAVLSLNDLKGRHLLNFEINLKSIDGEAIIVRTSSFPLKNDQGEVRGILYTIRDVTKEKEFEGMKLDFVSMSAHELRTPLTILRNYLDVLSSTINNKLTAEERSVLEKSKVGADQLISLVENLLYVTHIEEGILKQQMVPVDLEPVVVNVINKLQNKAHKENIQILFEKPKTPISPVMANSYLVEEALTNLITNGIEYNRPGGFILVVMEEQPGGITVHITDHGKGIPSYALPHLFTKFYRAADSLTQTSKGPGLGLYLTKTIIDAHKGKIWVNSIEGIGSTFSFTIPAVSKSERD